MRYGCGTQPEVNNGTFLQIKGIVMGDYNDNGSMTFQDTITDTFASNFDYFLRSLAVVSPFFSCSSVKVEELSVEKPTEPPTSDKWRGGNAPNGSFDAIIISGATTGVFLAFVLLAAFFVTRNIRNRESQLQDQDRIMATKVGDDAVLREFPVQHSRRVANVSDISSCDLVSETLQLVV